MYRKKVPASTHNEDQRNEPNEPQFEGVLFKDGIVVQHWLTGRGNISIWNSLADMIAIHGHPEYASELVWEDA